MKNQLGTFILLLTLSIGLGQSVDETIREKTKGKDVSEAVIRKIQRSGIFPDDQGFLRRLTYVETQFGDNVITYRTGYFGGVWQVDEANFNLTKTNTTQLFPIHQSISNIYKINWSNVTWNDLLKPLHSGLAARLYLTTLPDIPGTIESQSQFWKTHFRPTGSVELFTTQVKALESTPECQGMMDICIVLDGSGSIGSADFIKAKGFIANLVSNIALDISRVGLVSYSGHVNVEFPIQNNLTHTDMNSIISNMTYPSGTTNTALGLSTAVQLYNTTDIRPGVPRVVVTITDGVSDSRPELIQAVDELKNAKLISFAVGIGSGIDQSELLIISGDDVTNIFMITDYSALTEFLYRLMTATCEVPQKPAVGQNHTDSLDEGQRRHLHFEIPTSGMTILLEELSGNAAGWYSYSEATPNSAVHDGVLNGATFIPSTELMTSWGTKTQAGPQPNEVFITIQGNLVGTNYTISTVEGNKVPQEPSSTTVASTTTNVASTTTNVASISTTTQTETTTAESNSTTKVPTDAPISSGVSFLSSAVMIMIFTMFHKFL